LIKHFLSFFQKERTCAKKEKRKKRGLKEKKVVQKNKLKKVKRDE